MKFKASIVTLLIVGGFFESVSARKGLRGVFLYTYDASFDGADLYSQELSADAFKKAFSNKEYVPRPEPLQSSYEFLDLLDGRCNVKLECEKPSCITCPPTVETCSSTTTRRTSTPKEDSTTTTSRTTTPKEDSTTRRRSTPVTDLTTPTPSIDLSTTTGRVTTPKYDSTTTTSRTTTPKEDSTTRRRLTRRRSTPVTDLSTTTSRVTTPEEDSTTKTIRTTTPEEDSTTRRRSTPVTDLTTPTPGIDLSTTTSRVTTPKEDSTTTKSRITTPKEDSTTRRRSTPVTELTTPTPRIDLSTTTGRVTTPKEDSTTTTRRTTPYKAPVYIPQSAPSRPPTTLWTGTWVPNRGTFRPTNTYRYFIGGNTFSYRKRATGADITTTPKYMKEKPQNNEVSYE